MHPSPTCPLVEVSVATPRGWSQMRNDRRGRHSSQLGLGLVTRLPGRGIIDTGAERSVVRLDVCDRLVLPCTASVGIRGVAAPGRGRVSETTLRRAEITVAGAEFEVDVIAADVAHPGALMLIGMDILCHGRLFYDGPTGQLTLAFPNSVERRPPASGFRRRSNIVPLRRARG